MTIEQQIAEKIYNKIRTMLFLSNCVGDIDWDWFNTELENVDEEIREGVREAFYGLLEAGF